MAAFTRITRILAFPFQLLFPVSPLTEMVAYRWLILTMVASLALQIILFANCALIAEAGAGPAAWVCGVPLMFGHSRRIITASIFLIKEKKRNEVFAGIVILATSFWLVLLLSGKYLGELKL